MFSSCSAFKVYNGNQPLGPKQDDSVLLIGCVFYVDVQNLNTPIELVVSYYFDGSEEDRLRGFIVKTDSAGYFAVPNLPSGKYVISQVKNLELEEREGVREYSVGSQNEAHYYINSLNTDLLEFSVQSTTNIIDMSYIIICGSFDWLESPSYSLETHYRYQLDGEVFKESWRNIDGDLITTYHRYTRPPVAEYFLKKYPDSEWAPYLRQLIDKP